MVSARENTKLEVWMQIDEIFLSLPETSRRARTWTPGCDLWAEGWTKVRGYFATPSFHLFLRDVWFFLNIKNPYWKHQSSWATFFTHKWIGMRNTGIRWYIYFKSILQNQTWTKAGSHFWWYYAYVYKAVLIQKACLTLYKPNRIFDRSGKIPNLKKGCRFITRVVMNANSFINHSWLVEERRHSSRPQERLDLWTSWDISDSKTGLDLWGISRKVS